MRRTGLIIAATVVTALFGSAGSAFAQTQAKPKAPLAADARATARDAYALDQGQGRSIIELDTQKKWGLKLEMNQPVTRDIRLKDVEAGAYYKFTQAFRLGGAVGLADKDAPDEAARLQEKTKEQVTPRVKLNAIFKF